MNNHEQLHGSPDNNRPEDMGHYALSPGHEQPEEEINPATTDREPQDMEERLALLEGFLDEQKKIHHFLRAEERTTPKDKALEVETPEIIIQESTTSFSNPEVIGRVVREMALKTAQGYDPHLVASEDEETLLNASTEIMNLVQWLNHNTHEVIKGLENTIKSLRQAIATKKLLNEKLKDPAYGDAFEGTTIFTEYGYDNDDLHMGPVLKKLAKQRSNPPLIDPSAPEPLNFPESVDNGL